MWDCVGFLAIFPLIWVLVWFFDPSLRRRREFAAELANRKQVNDEELFALYYVAEETPADVPGRVRRVFAKHMDLQAEKLLPDDDLMFYWAEEDMVYLIRDLECEFGIEITKEDDATVPECTIRATSHLVFRKAHPNRPLTSST